MNIAYLIKPKNSIAYVYNTSTLRQCIEKMKHHRYSAIPVITTEGYYFGTVTASDLLWATQENQTKGFEEKIKISSVIKPDRVKPAGISASMEELLFKLTEQNFVPITDDREYFMGIVTRKDVIKNFNTIYLKGKKTAK